MIVPLRVIHIGKTLESGGGIVFDVPTDWQFHIISHTWTKDVRDWSVEVANMMARRKEPENDQLVHVDTYAQLFKEACFAGKRGYDELVEFLRILAADGVEAVWLDALCINQEDTREKDREIAHMGAYYACALGCYVWCHGIGGGFRLWRQAPAPAYYKLPRWFSRVWTLQEFVLPSKLAFIVGMDKEGCAAWFSYKAYCRSTHMAWQPQELMDSALKSKIEKRIYFLNRINSRSYFPCPHCSVSKGHVYLLERTRYLDLMECSSYISIQDGRLPPTFWGEFKSPVYRMLTMLSCSSNQHQQGQMQLAAFAIREISVRDCSQGHEEDRLLSILGLLQIEGKVQLRTGRSLNDQIFEVVQNLLQTSSSPAEHHRLVLFLCLAQYRGSPAIGMSWAPTFSFQRVVGDMKLQSLSMFHNFTTIAQVLDLSKLGQKLRCPFLQAKVIPFPQHWQNCSTCHVCRRSESPPFRNRMKHFIFEVQKLARYSAFLWACFSQDYGDEICFLTVPPPTCTMGLTVGRNSVEKLATMPFHVWLLLLAQDQLPGCTQPYGLFLVCVGNDKGNLHKVGVFVGGPGWNPETEEDSEYAVPDVQSGDSISEEGDFENEEIEELHGYEGVVVKEDFKYEYEAGQLEEEENGYQQEQENDEEEEEEEEEGEEVGDWREDLESMEWDTFGVGGFGECIPLHHLQIVGDRLQT